MHIAIIIFWCFESTMNQHIELQAIQLKLAPRTFDFQLITI